MKKKYPTVYAFIDSQNLNLGIRYQGWELDFKKFRVYLEEKYNVTKAFLFIGEVIGKEDLYKYLLKAGYELIFKPTVKAGGGKAKIKGNVDAELVLHTMIQWSNFDKAVIISGDGDFYCLIRHLDENGKLLKILTPSRRYSSLLRAFANKISQVTSFRKKVQRSHKK